MACSTAPEPAWDGGNYSVDPAFKARFKLRARTLLNNNSLLLCFVSKTKALETDFALKVAGYEVCNPQGQLSVIVHY